MVISGHSVLSPGSQEHDTVAGGDQRDKTWAPETCSTYDGVFEQHWREHSSQDRGPGPPEVTSALSLISWGPLDNLSIRPLTAVRPQSLNTGRSHGFLANTQCRRREGWTHGHLAPVSFGTCTPRGGGPTQTAVLPLTYLVPWDLPSWECPPRGSQGTCTVTQVSGSAA